MGAVLLGTRPVSRRVHPRKLSHHPNRGREADRDYPVHCPGNAPRLPGLFQLRWRNGVVAGTVDAPLRRYCSAVCWPSGYRPLVPARWRDGAG
jgi:hypothetical protein